MISSTSPGTSGRPSGLNDGCVPVARLTLESELTDHRDRTNGLVSALCAPCCDGGILQGAVEREVELDVPGKTLRRRQASLLGVRDGVRDRVPAARRCLRTGPRRCDRRSPSSRGRADHVQRCLLVRSGRRIANGWRARVDGQSVLRDRKSEAAYVPPLGTDKGLSLGRDGQASLDDDLAECERLPERAIVHRRSRL